MARYMQQRPAMIDTEVERSKTQSWAAVLMDQPFDREPAKYSEVQLLKCQLVGSAEQSNKQAISKVAKLLIVSEPTRTTMYMTLKEPEPIHIVRRFLEPLLKRFGIDVLKQADRSLHPMNLKDKKRIENWRLARELEVDREEEVDEASAKRQRCKGPAHLANVGEWAQEACEVAAESNAMAYMESRLATVTQTMDMLMSEFSNLGVK